MAYIGQGPGSSGITDRTLDTVTSDGSTTSLVLTGTADAAEDVAVYFDGVMQRPGTDFTLANNTLTFTSPVPNGVFVCAYTGGAEHIGSPLAGSVTSDMIVDNAVIDAKVATGVDASRITGALGAFDGSALTGISGNITKTSSDPTITDNPSSAGGLHLNTTTGEMFVCTDNATNENVWVNVGGGSGDIFTFQGRISGYVSGGYDNDISSATNVIEKFSLTSDGNTNNVGDLTVARNAVAGQTSSIHGYSSGGSPGILNVIDKFSFTTDGDATNISDLTVARYYVAGQSSETHGYTSGGNSGGPIHDEIDKFSFASNDNATDVGNLTVPRNGHAGQNSTTYGYSSGGHIPGVTDVIDRFSFASNGNATNVGVLTISRRYVGANGQSSTTYGYTSGGVEPAYDRIDKFSFASNNDATDVGNLTPARGHTAGQSSTTDGYCCGGYTGSSTIDRIDKFSFASNNDSTYVGDLASNKSIAAGQQY